MEKLNLSRLNYALLLLLSIIMAAGCTNAPLLTSPDGSIVVRCQADDQQQAVYSIEKNGEPILLTSLLGVVMDDADFSKKMHLLTSSEITDVTDNYEMIQGKIAKSAYYGRQQIYTFINANSDTMNVIFSVSDDGVAFRYHFPKRSDEMKTINEEVTSFRFSPEAKAWMQPMSVAKTGWSRTNPSYEEFYEKEIPVGTMSPLGKGWVFPALFKTGNNWVLLTETALGRNYSACRLYAKGDATYQIGFPEPGEHFHDGSVNPQSTLPWTTPWRVIALGSLKTIIESTLETDLANSRVEGDFSWIKPGKSSWSWVLLKDDSTVFDVQKKYVDYAVEMNWDYCLVDADWDQKIGYDKIKTLVDYAATKNVGINVWYNSSGDWNDTPYTPKSKLLTNELREAEFAKLHEIGIKGIKVDFFGGDGQSVINYYIDLMESAARHQLMINFHGCTYPRSWHRTFPNLATMESIKGMEFATFDQNNANEMPAHGAMVGFTRNVFSPMDFTPMCLHDLIPMQRATTNTYELATAVLFLSGIQHYAERPEGVYPLPNEVKDILRSLPAVYDESVFVDGYPGKLTIIARRSGNVWYVAGINGENVEKPIGLDLSFISGNKGILINEGETKYIMNVEKIELNDGQVVETTLKPNGGFLMMF